MNVFAALHMSAYGTKRTYRDGCCLSAFGAKADIRDGAMRFAYCALHEGRVRLSRRLNVERLGNGGDLGALALDRGGELLWAAGWWRLRGRVGLVVVGCVVGLRGHVGAGALAQFRR